MFDFELTSEMISYLSRIMLTSDEAIVLCEKLRQEILQTIADAQTELAIVDEKLEQLRSKGDTLYNRS